MPYIEDLEEFDYHEPLEWDQDSDDNIWRYLDLEQFLSLMHRSSLRFGRANSFSDNLEGTVPTAESIPQNLDIIYRRAPEITNISCWHRTPSESMTMWEIYSNRGVVIESTPHKLRKSFCDERKFGIHFADVQYCDFTQESFNIVERLDDGGVSGNYLEPFQYKREYYKGKNEFRAITGPLASEEHRKRVVENNKKEDNWNVTIDRHKTPGIFVTVDLEELIESIVISPFASDRDYKAVKELADRKHDLIDLVELSDIRTKTMVAKYSR